MFGCRPETDRSSLKSLSVVGTQKSHRFSEQIRDRFYSDTSFEKHAKSLKSLTDNKVEKPLRTKPLLVDGLSERQIKEIREDELRLRAIEQQLEAIREKKAMKVMRARQRAQNKLRFLSSCKIQYALKSYIIRKKNLHVDIIVDFLRYLLNNWLLI
jgi:hypothetical protein